MYVIYRIIVKVNKCNICSVIILLSLFLLYFYSLIIQIHYYLLTLQLLMYYVVKDLHNHHYYQTLTAKITEDLESLKSTASNNRASPILNHSGFGTPKSHYGQSANQYVNRAGLLSATQHLSALNSDNLSNCSGTTGAKGNKIYGFKKIDNYKIM